MGNSLVRARNDVSKYLGSKIAEFIGNIDFSGIAQKFFTLLGSALGAGVSLIWGAIENLVNSIGEYFSGKIDECGGNVALGLLKGIADGLLSIGKWIKDNIFKPFIEGFKKAFGIHSPSKEMAVMGGYIIDGLFYAISDGIGGTMYQVSEAFLEALKNYENIQHIKATIIQIDGTVYTLEDDELLGTPRYDKQCVENPDVFNFGEMYVGTAEVTVQMPGVLSNRFRGRELRLEFGVDISENEIEWIPLGVWDITEPKRETGDRIILQCSDRMNRLKVRCDSNATGFLRLQNVLNYVSEKAGVEFAQTAQEIAELAEEQVHILSKISFAETCWEEVRMISQVIGGFAFANREGKIEFRKFRDVDYSIIADNRKEISLCEYGFHVKGISYTDKYGQTYSTGISRIGVGSVLSFSDNGYIPSIDREDNVTIGIDRIKWINDELRLLMWTPGTVSFYGNPALDVGDIIRIEGGINGKGNTGFLIGTDSWQFRSPQTIISPGTSETGTVSSHDSGSSGSGVASITNVTVTKAVNTIVLEKHHGELYKRNCC